ncbi:MAG: binding-protein-dependent transport system inner rane protein [Deltaproteobacteria bacterium]|nr:binding-protein-dependent transport system inner rane protein [Deltaproteobacteria bacterium]
MESVLRSVRALLPTARGSGLLTARSTLLFASAAILSTVLLLLLIVLVIAFQDPLDSSIYTLKNFRLLYLEPFVYHTLLNTAGFTLVSTVTALFFAVPIAWFAERTDLPGRSTIFPLMMASTILPGLFGALGWLFMFHPRIGTINRWLVDALPFFENAPINILSIPGMGFISGLGMSSLAFIMLAATFRAMDPALEESAQVHGLGFVHRFWKVTLPLMWPGILAVAIYISTIGLASFDVPAIIGMANRIFTFSTFVYIHANPEDGPPNFGIVGAASVLMILVALILSWLYVRVIKQSHKYSVVTGKNYRPRIVELGRWWIVGWVFIAAKLLLGVVLPLLTLIWASLIPYFQPFSISALDLVSLENFYRIPWDRFWQAATNTAILTLVVPTLLVLIGLVISWVVIRSGSKYAGLIDTAAFMPHAVPNLIFSVALLVVALFWLPEFIPFYNTIYILIASFVIARISFPTRVYNNALLQIHKELDEAAYVSGLGTLRVLRHVLIPLLRPATVYAWIWMALLSYRELTLAAFLTGRENQTLPTLILGLVSAGQATIAAAVSLLLFIFMIPLVVLYFLFGRRSFQVGDH